MNTQNTNTQNRQSAILAILNAYGNLDITQIELLIKATNEIGGVSAVSIKGYSSDISQNSEIANQLINVGANYENMLTKDSNIYANFDVDSVDVERFDYSTIDTAKLTLEQFKAEVKNQLSVALNELQAPKKSNDTSADIWLNKALVFNLNTMRLSIRGMQMIKSVEVKGTFKVVKSAPKTIAKKLIEKQAKGRSATLRRFAIDNLIGSIKLVGTELEIG
jgi:hypothetical protein